MPDREFLGVTVIRNANVRADLLRFPACAISKALVIEFHVADIAVIADDSVFVTASPLFFVDEILRVGVPEYAGVAAADDAGKFVVICVSIKFASVYSENRSVAFCGAKKSFPLPR